MAQLPEFPIYAYQRARSTQFSLQYLALRSASLLMPGKHPAVRPAGFDWKLIGEIRADMTRFLREDVANIGRGLYPLSVLRPESPLRHLLRIPKLYLDGVGIHLRRQRGRTTEFGEDAKDYLDEVPRYYRRNFHFQTGGYLSERSAELYEHQVEMLFQGTADAMRRLIIPPMRDTLGSRDGKGLRILEIGAGTGRATRFVHLAFPKARIVASDLSDPYLKVAREHLADLPRVDFFRADGARLPFRDGEFDAVYSVFLFHELPHSAREEILAESRRVLKPGRFLGLVDSIQLGDRPRYDHLLENFPQEFHEPYYREYIHAPMESMLEPHVEGEPRSRVGFYSKVCWGRGGATAKPRIQTSTDRRAKPRGETPVQKSSREKKPIRKR